MDRIDKNGDGCWESLFHRIDINRLILKGGHHKAKFLKIQETAKEKGEGIWSYEVS